MEAQLATTKRIRPLPRVPTTPTSYQSSVHSQTGVAVVYKHRPLPEPPASSPILPAYTEPPTPSTPLLISVTPPTPPYVPPCSSSLQPLPSLQCRRVKKGLLKVQTSPELLRHIDESVGTPACSPLTPAIPQPPSPSTARRRRISKLRRQLGAGVPSELVLSCPSKQPKWVPPPTTEESKEMRDSDDEDSDIDDDSSWVVSPSTPAFRIIEHKEYNNSTEKILPPWATVFKSYGPTNHRRGTIKKWVWEKGGQRWDESDYSQVLQQLRKL